MGVAHSLLHQEVEMGQEECRDLSSSGWPGVHSDTFSLGFLKPGSCHEFPWLCFEQFLLFSQVVGTLVSLEIRPGYSRGGSLFIALSH